MAKGWTHFSTVNDVVGESAEQKKTRMRTTNRYLRTVKPIMRMN